MVKRFLKLSILLMLFQPLYAITPWWNADWHYRVAINVTNAVVNQTGKIDIDFNALGLGGDLDENSIRIVRPDGTLVTQQEFTDVLYANATDTLNNGRGELKFILEDTGNVTYYVYYDKIENGTKVALSNAVMINGNFEHSTGSTPTGWVTGQSNIGTNLPNNEVHPLATEGATVTINSSSVQNTAHTGEAFHLHGYRDRDESGSQKEVVYIEKQFSVPASSAGDLTYWFRVQAFDDINYDYLQVQINGTVINPNNLQIVNSNLAVTTTKYGRSSAYGGYLDAGWTKATLNLSAYAGTTITIRISHYFASDNAYRSWQLIDDMEWSLNTAIVINSQEEPPTAIMTMNKSSCVLSDLINGTTNPKRIPGATIRFALEVKNEGGASASNNGANGSANGVNPIKLDFGTIGAGSSTTPTYKCGYFEVKLK